MAYKKNQTSKEVLRTEHVYGIGFTATASVETANVEHVFIMREACHVDMTGLLGIVKKSAVEHTWLIAINCLIHCPRQYRPRYNCIKL